MNTGTSMAASNVDVFYCNYGQNGVYYLTYLQTITDSQSTYTNNSGGVGIYSITGNTAADTYSDITISSNYYYNNYGSSGGIFVLTDYVYATISSCYFSQS